LFTRLSNAFVQAFAVYQWHASFQVEFAEDRRRSSSARTVLSCGFLLGAVQHPNQLMADQSIAVLGCVAPEIVTYTRRWRLANEVLVNPRLAQYRQR
jgi:hypothetical protein